MSKSRFFVLAVIAIVLITPAPAIFASCDHIECRRFYDTSECWLRYGPNATRHPVAESCKGGICDCIWDSSQGYVCSCYCEYNYCYVV